MTSGGVTPETSKSQLPADLAYGSDGSDRRLLRLEPIGLDDLPESIERDDVVLAEADVGLRSLERQLDRLHAVDFLNGDPHAMGTHGAVHPEDLPLNPPVLRPRLRGHQ